MTGLVFRDDKNLTEEEIGGMRAVKTMAPVVNKIAREIGAGAAFTALMTCYLEAAIQWDEIPAALEGLQKAADVLTNPTALAQMHAGARSPKGAH